MKTRANDAELRLKALPQEILYNILKHTQPSGTLKLRESCRFFYKLGNDNHLWAHYHQLYWGKPPSALKASKQQFIAEYLYDDAFTERCESAQTRFKKLYQFLLPHHKEAWAQYYLGLLYYHGQGVKRDYKKGIDYFIASSLQKNYQSIIKLLVTLNQVKSYQPIVFNSIYGSLEASKVIPVMLGMLRERNHPAFKKLKSQFYLAWFYRHGIGVDKNISHAEALYIASIKQNFIQAAPELVNLIHEQNPSHTDLIPNNQFRTCIENLITLLETLATESRYKPMRAELHYQTAWQYRVLQNQQESIRHLKRAATLGHTRAQIEVIDQDFHLHRDIPFLKEEAILKMTEIAETGSKQAIMHLFGWLELPADEKISVIKSLHPSAIYFIASEVARDYWGNTLDELIEHPYRIVWMQFAAENGCEQSLATLQSHTHTNHPGGINPYIACALGTIYHFGILGSSEIETDHDKAMRYILIALQKDHDIIRKYVQIGRDEGLINDEVVHFLESQDTDYQPNNRRRPL